MTDTFAIQLATVMGEVMNLAGQVRRGDDAAWDGIGPDAHIRLVSELVAFADLVARAEAVLAVPPSVRRAATLALALGEEIRTTGIPVSEAARRTATELLDALGVGPDVLAALDGGAP